jgi:hypothetical protein
MPRSALVSLIYDAIDDPAARVPFLRKFSDAMHAGSVGLLGGSPRAKDLVTFGVADITLKTYVSHYDKLNPFFPTRRLMPGNVETGNQSVSDSALVKTEFYNDFFKPNDWLHVATGIIDVAQAQAEFRAIFAIRSPGENPFGADELDLVRYLDPHLRRAAAISHRMADLQGRVDQIVSGELDMKCWLRCRSHRRKPISPSRCSRGIPLRSTRRREASASTPCAGK